VPEVLGPDISSGPKDILKISEIRAPNVENLPKSHMLTLPCNLEYTAKVYRAKLWLACAGIYRRAAKWEGAQAALQDALLCDVCPEEVFTEVFV
jgi:hypothetical protein